MKQFDLSVLPKLTHAELEFQRLWPRFDPSLETENNVIRNTLSEVEGTVINLSALRLKTARVDKRENVLRFLDDTALRVCGTYTTSGSSFLLSTPKSLAKKLVFSLLGARSTQSQPVDRISDIEIGIFTFIVTSITEAIQSRWREIGISFRLATLDAPLDSATLLKTPHVIELHFELEHDKMTQDIRLLLEPDVELFSTLNGSKDKQHTQRGARVAGDAPVALRISVGEASILARDVEGLKVDNILMLDKTRASLVSGQLSGLVACQVGESTNATISAHIFRSESDQYAIQLGSLPSEVPS